MPSLKEKGDRLRWMSYVSNNQLKGSSAAAQKKETRG